jgi:hypothetical protein
MGFSFTSKWAGAKGRSSGSAEIWYYVDDGEAVGPLTLQQLKRIIAALPNGFELLVWRNKFSDWKKAGDVPELLTHLGEASPSLAPIETAPADKQTLSRRRRKWLPVIVAFASLGSVGSRVGREKMARVSADRFLGTEVTREGRPAEFIANLVNYIKINWVGALVVIPCLAYGIYDGLLLDSLSSGLIAGLLCAGLLNLLVWAARKYRVKKPSPHLILAGNISFGLGCAVALYCLGLSIHHVTQVTPGSAIVNLKEMGGVLLTGTFYLMIGLGVRYVLGADRYRGKQRRGD